jgi:hypothetical protein
MAGRAGRSVERQPAFWDASALVPLCVRQRFTSRAVLLFKKYEPVVWWATPVEIASALARLVRMRQLAPRDWAESEREAKGLAEEWSVIQPSDALRKRAVGLVDRHRLRAADALQLAAALEWCSGIPTGKVFLATDERLRDAAVLSGFEGEQI